MVIFCSNRTASLISTGQAIHLDQVCFSGFNTQRLQYFIEANVSSYGHIDIPSLFHFSSGEGAHF
jgi:hypothetical protein